MIIDELFDIGAPLFGVLKMEFELLSLIFDFTGVIIPASLGASKEGNMDENASPS